ncbi:MAG: hypothetical protein ACM3X0_08820 [Bacteroidota bacterium]
MTIISSAELAALIRDIEVEDPIDYADLPYAEDELRRLVCTHIREIAEQAAQLGEAECQAVLLAVAAKLVLENLVLNLRLMRAQGKTPDADCAALFKRWRGDG